MNVIEFTLGIQSTKQIDSSTVCFEISYGQQEFSPFTKSQWGCLPVYYRINGLKPKIRAFWKWQNQRILKISLTSNLFDFWRFKSATLIQKYVYVVIHLWLPIIYICDSTPIGSVSIVLISCILFI